ncbi:MAG: FtsQ-type POTRA domain-containing protein [Verrucomicrobiota bacterium]|nr:FtsQ-type POTRA domain-containing protein [Verrucomicrobiota bacterium]
MNYRRSTGINPKLLNVKVTSRKKTTVKTQSSGKFLLVLVIVVFSLTATVLATKFLAQKMFYENESYTLQNIYIDNHAQMSQVEILQIAQVKKGDNLFALDLEEVRSKLEGIPHIKNAEVYRQLPDSLTIRLIERQPVARLGLWSGKVDNGVRVIDQYLLDDESVVMGRRPAQSPHYPFLVGLNEKQEIKEGMKLANPEAIAACKLLKRIDVSPARSIIEIVQIDVSKKDQVTLVLNDGARIKVLSQFVDEHIERLEAILNYTHQNEKILQTADLTVDRNVPVVFQP